MTIVLGFGIEAEEAMGSQILWNLKSWKNKVSPLFLSVPWLFFFFEEDTEELELDNISINFFKSQTFQKWTFWM